MDGTHQKYDEILRKRQKITGMQQYVDIRTSNDLKWLLQDPWVETDHTSIEEPQDGRDFMVVIVGAGFAGVLSAIHLIKLGVAVDRILLVDAAGGFGGTWWWNR
jgi:hypothetical protein